MSNLSLQNIEKSYGNTKVMHDVSLEIDQGEFVVFVGPSGCGKSTLLRMIAGLEQISGGSLFIGGTLMNTMPASKRGIAMVFQSYALYPHMSVFENMAFSLRIAKTPDHEVKEKVTKAAKILQLDAYLDRLPKALSGGQRQRVAIGRAIVREPDVFLFDEALSNLDAELRVRTRIEIAKLKESMPDTTMIYVTHDQVEALTLADKIVVLRDGRVEQVGSPMELYNRPCNQFVAGFIGSPKMNFVSASSENGALHAGGEPFPFETAHSGELIAGIRPEHLQLTTKESGFFSAVLDMVEHLGEFSLLYCNTDRGEEITMKVSSEQEFASGETLFFETAPKHLHLFDKDTRKRIG